MDKREVKVHRVVNIVERRNPMPHAGLDSDRDFIEDQRYGGPRNYQNTREYYNEGSYPAGDRHYFDKDPKFGSFRRHSPPPRNEGPYSQQYYGRNDLRHQLDTRYNGRPGPYFHSRNRGLGPPRRPALDRAAKEDQDYRINPHVTMRDPSPGRREGLPTVLRRSGSNISNKSFAPEWETCYSSQQVQQKQKPYVPLSHSPSGSVEGYLHSSDLHRSPQQEKTPASLPEEVVAASMEPKLTPEKDSKSRRTEAIKAKALEIEKDFRQDCEMFCMVVKLLVAKAPSLENLLQGPLDEILMEIQQRCLDELRRFVKELDGVLQQQDTSAQPVVHI